MITAEGLANAGYRAFRDNGSFLKGEGCTCLWQKRVEDGKGTRYFINVYEWRLDRIIRDYPGPVPSFEPETTFSMSTGDQNVHVTYPVRGAAIGEVEDFFDGMWRKMEFGYEEINESYSAVAA